MTRRHPAYPARPLLRPGVQVAGAATATCRSASTRGWRWWCPTPRRSARVLDGLREGTAPPHPDLLSDRVARLCADLLDRGLVVDGDDLLAALGAAPDRRTRESVAALFADTGMAAGPLLRARARVPVTVSHDRAPRSARRCRELLAAAGVGTTSEAATGPVLHRLPLRGRPWPDRRLDAGRPPASAGRARRRESCASARSWCPGRPPACAASTRTTPSATHAARWCCTSTPPRGRRGSAYPIRCPTT